MERIIKPCPFCGGKANAWLNNGKAIINCSNGCSVEVKEPVKTNVHSQATLENIEEAFDNAAEDWNHRDIGENKREVVTQVVTEIVRYGQKDKRFKLGETIKYAPNEIVEILYKAWGCEPAK